MGKRSLRHYRQWVSGCAGKKGGFTSPSRSGTNSKIANQRHQVPPSWGTWTQVEQILAQTAIKLSNGSFHLQKYLFQTFRKGRKKFSEAVQLITGHNFVQRHKVIVQEDDDPLCRSCGEDKETSHHVVAECPAFAAIRLKVLGTPVLQGTLHWSTQIAEFLREINFSSLQDQVVE